MSNRDGNYFLCNDIQFTATLSPLFGSDSFRGIIDGNNRALRGVNLSGPSLPSYGLVRVLEGGTIRNLRIIGPQVQGKGVVGAVAGLSSGLIQNVSIEGGQITSERRPAGAIVGVQLNGSLQNCSSTAFVTTEGETNDQLIGLGFP